MATASSQSTHSEGVVSPQTGGAKSPHKSGAKTPEEPGVESPKEMEPVLPTEEGAKSSLPGRAQVAVAEALPQGWVQLPDGSRRPATLLEAEEFALREAVLEEEEQHALLGWAQRQAEVARQACAPTATAANSLGLARRSGSDFLRPAVVRASIAELLTEEQARQLAQEMALVAAALTATEEQAEALRWLLLDVLQIPAMPGSDQLETLAGAFDARPAPLAGASRRLGKLECVDRRDASR